MAREENKDKGWSFIHGGTVCDVNKDSYIRGEFTFYEDKVLDWFMLYGAPFGRTYDIQIGDKGLIRTCLTGYPLREDIAGRHVQTSGTGHHFAHWQAKVLVRTVVSHSERHAAQKEYH